MKYKLNKQDDNKEYINMDKKDIRKQLIYCISFVLFFFLSNLTGYAKDFYVSPKGNDKNSAVEGCHIYNIGGSSVCFVGDINTVWHKNYNIGLAPALD